MVQVIAGTPLPVCSALPERCQPRSATSCLYMVCVSVYLSLLEGGGEREREREREREFLCVCFSVCE